jgi:hypothetical protein
MTTDPQASMENEILGTPITQVVALTAANLQAMYATPVLVVPAV